MHKNLFKEENRSGENGKNGGVYCTICGNDAHECRRYAAVGLGIETVYADETQTTTKTFTANQLTKAFAGGADGTSCELGKKVGMLH